MGSNNGVTSHKVTTSHVKTVECGMMLWLGNIEIAADLPGEELVDLGVPRDR